MWPKSILRDETCDVMQAVRSKVFVVEQVPDRWGDLHPVCCKECRTITTTPWCVSQLRSWHDAHDTHDTHTPSHDTTRHDTHDTHAGGAAWTVPVRSRTCCA